MVTVVGIGILGLLPTRVIAGNGAEGIEGVPLGACGRGDVVGVGVTEAGGCAGVENSKPISLSFVQ